MILKGLCYLRLIINIFDIFLDVCRAPKLSLKMSVEEEQSYIQKSMWLAMEYEDEPDDSYNPF